MADRTIIKRKRGNVVKLLVEIDASQSKELENTVSRIGITKSEAISQALNIWFNLLQPKDGG